MITLAIEHGGLQTTLVFPGTSVRIGSAADSDLRLEAPGVAPLHARFDRVQEGWEITLADAAAPTPALPGDIFVVGSARITVIACDAGVASAPRVASSATIRLRDVLTDLRRTHGDRAGAAEAAVAWGEACRLVFGEAVAGTGAAAAATAAPDGDQGRYPLLIGRSAALRGATQILDRVVATDLPILITGESGTGKELLARSLHQGGPRAGHAFVRENCAAIPENLLESELFGHGRGAFTGAHVTRRGLFVEADGGTIFLDEIGDMSLPMQAKILRVLQEGEVRAVGTNTTVNVNVRVITATNRDLRKMVDEGRFREDLFFRLNVVGIRMPPLRERIDDVPMLVAAFLEQVAQRTGLPLKEVKPDAMGALMRWHWPGNIRELRNEIERAATMVDGAITLADLTPEIAARGEPSRETGGGLRDLSRHAAEQAERQHIIKGLTDARGNKAAAARSLGISRTTLGEKIRRLGIDDNAAKLRRF